MKKEKITKEQLEEGINQTGSMLQASELIGIPYSTFIRHAKKHGLYNPNQGGAGFKKPWKDTRKKKLEDFLKRDTVVSSSRLKKALWIAGLLKEECSDCGIGPEWNGKSLTLQLDHIDGDSRNNLLENLRILCPNCHSQTETFCRGQGKNYRD